MAFSEHCPCGQSQQPVTPELGDNMIAIDRETFRQIFSLLNRSTDVLVNARHREIFLECLNSHLLESNGFDGDQLFQASLLLDAYYEYVSPSLAELGTYLDEAREIT